AGSCSMTAAGAADPMTTLAAELVPETNRGPEATTLSENSAFGPPLRAESAAKGETCGARLEVISGRRVASGKTDVFRADCGALELDAAPLSNCSKGSNRCACTIFNRPSSKWKRCSCR